MTISWFIWAKDMIDRILDLYRDNKKRITYLLLSFVSISTLYLFYLYVNKLAKSDFHAHIKSALNLEGYSLATIIIKFFYDLTNSKTGVAIGFTVIVLLTIIIETCCIKMISKMFDLKIDNYSLINFSSTSIFLSKIVLPFLSPRFYSLGSILTQPWHNSTYLLMRLMGNVTMTLFFIIQKDYLNKIDFKNWLFFVIFLTLVNFSKPNFIIAFAPIMLVYLLFDFIKTKGKKLEKAVSFGVAVLISCNILIFQYKALYVIDDSSKIAMSFSNAIDTIINIRLVPDIICNFVFPLLITYYAFKNRSKMNQYLIKILQQTWLICILSIAEFLFIIETGKRANDGNFGWGMHYFSYFLYIISYIAFIFMSKNKILSKKQNRIIISTYLINLLFGLIYFLLLLLKITPWKI